jgi:hypothetical protein
MKKNLSKAELDAAEAAFAKQAYKDRAKHEQKAIEVMAAMRAESSQVTIRTKNVRVHSQHLDSERTAAKGREK